jgi:hypothetical protein
MAKLGSFGAAIREYAPTLAEPDTFEFCGEEFEVAGHVPAIIELTMSAAMAGKVSAIDGDAAMYEVLRFALTDPERRDGDKVVPADESQWDRFYRLAAAQDPEPEVLTSVALNILAAQVGRPTKQRSTSSAGPLPTSPSSSSSASDSPDSPDSTPDGAGSTG